MGNVFNPEMLTLARESKGWSQSDLAAQLDVTQATVSKIENGLIGVHAEELAGFSKALGYTEDFFCQRPKIYGIGSTYLFHRKRQTTTIATQRQIQANINILRLQVERLLRGVNLEFERSFAAVAPSDSDYEPRTMAQMVRAAWRVPMGPIQNLTGLVEDAGGLVLKCDFATPKIDAAHLRLDGLPPLFFMNREMPGDRLRWTLAHELGHAFLHTSCVGENIEAEADAFAGEFLMPAKEIKPQLYEMTLERAAELKHVWKVSMASLIRQARDHECISDWKYKHLCIAISKRGYRTLEPYPLAIEEPTLLKDLVAIHKDGLGYDSFELARLLFMNDPQFFAGDDAPRLMRVDGKSFFAFNPPRPQRPAPVGDGGGTITFPVNRPANSAG